MRYVVKVELPESPTGGYGAQVIDLEECFTSADSLEDLVVNLREIVDWWFEEHERLGAPSPLPARPTSYLLQIEVPASDPAVDGT